MTGRYHNLQTTSHQLPSFLLEVPIIGRERELRLVMHHYEAVADGQARILLLTGEPGIGKTRLLDGIMRFAAHQGAVVLRGGASEAEGMPPYLPFLEALGRYIQDIALDQLNEQVASALPVLASIFPELTARLGEPTTPYPLPPEQARYRLYEALGAFLYSISLSRVLVLLFDDLHWADTASLDLICHLARRQSHARILLVGAYRDCELERNGSFNHMVSELSRRRILTTVTVDPLTRQEIELLSLHILGSRLSAEMGTLLFTHSEGNPFFAEELLQDWLETGALVQQRHQWGATDSFSQTLPPSIVGALRQRFARLSTECIDDLRIAALIGRTFDPLVLTMVQRKDIETIESHLIEAVQARLVHVDPARGFAFSHDKIRECLVAEVSTSRRKKLHGTIGLILEECMKQGTDKENIYQLAELAYHFVHSDDRERGIAYSLRAAMQAQGIYAVEEMRFHYHTALTLLKPDDKRRGELLLKLEKATMMADHEGETEQAYSTDLEAHQVRSPISTPLPANLTAREVMVLQRVAQGKRNDQIAEEMGLSRKTVTNHLTHIFNKTACENRAAATAFAIRKGLV